MNKTKKRRALGRGLSNLIPVEKENTETAGRDVAHIDIDAISPNPFQPRVDFNDEEIAGLAASIKTQGLLQPVVVRSKLDGFEIVSGERRFRAMRSLKWDTIPCIVKKKISDREMLEMALVENIQRENLNDIETALAYQKLLLECSLSHDELARRVGKSRSALTNALRLLKLPQKIQKMVRDNALSMGHARALLSIDDEKKQIDIAQHIVRDKLTVREVEQLVAPKTAKKPGTMKKPAPSSDPDMQVQIEKLQYHFGTAVKISANEKMKGKIELQFHSADDLNRILDIIFA